METFFSGKLHVDAHTVCQIAGLTDDFRVSTGNSFGVYIAPEPVFCPQKGKGLIHKLHGMGRIFYNAGAEKQAFDIVPAVEFHSDSAKLLRCKGCSHPLVGPAVQTVFTVIDTFIRKKHL